MRNQTELACKRFAFWHRFVTDISFVQPANKQRFMVRPCTLHAGIGQRLNVKLRHKLGAFSDGSIAATNRLTVLAFPAVRAALKEAKNKS